MSDNGADRDRTEVASLAVSAVALVIAVVALLGTAAQVLQQYLATAVGYSNCGERVMGPWARFTRLVFHPWELRFEVVFGSPEIVVEPYFMPGLPEKEGEDMDRRGLPDPRAPLMAPLLRDGKTPAANYWANWLTLLRTVHDMEVQAINHRDDCARSFYRRVSENEEPLLFRMRVSIRANVQTLDLIPEGVKKPYATTTLSSLVHLAAMLGVHWKQFDGVNDRYLADGNGILMTGSSIPHLGIIFTFVRHHTPKFTRMRVIPTPYLPGLAFGLVSTILGPPVERHRYIYMSDVPRNLDTLRLGSVAEIKDTLGFFGCDDRTIVACIDGGDRPFPVLFQIVGMLARTMRIRGTPFRALPNPLPYRWDTRSFSLSKLLTRFAIMLEKQKTRFSGLSDSEQLFSDIRDRAISLRGCIEGSDDLEIDLKYMASLHDALDWCDEWFSFAEGGRTKKEVIETVRIHIERNAYLKRSVEEPEGDVVGEFEGLMDFIRKSQKGTGEVDTWLVLVFRMICWLNLHTFHPGDIQLPKSELMGSQLPVYIS